MEGKAINSADAISHTFSDWEQAQALFFFFFPAVLPQMQYIYVEIKTKARFCCCLKLGSKERCTQTMFYQGDLVPERLKNLEKKREKEAAEKKERDRQVKIGFIQKIFSHLTFFWFQVRERLELLRQQAAAAALEVPNIFIVYCVNGY